MTKQDQRLVSPGAEVCADAPYEARCWGRHSRIVAHRGSRTARTSRWAGAAVPMFMGISGWSQAGEDCCPPRIGEYSPSLADTKASPRRAFRFPEVFISILGDLDQGGSPSVLRSWRLLGVNLGRGCR